VNKQWFTTHAPVVVCVAQGEITTPEAVQGLRTGGSGGRPLFLLPTDPASMPESGVDLGLEQQDDEAEE
jgi:hypothetical protein